LWLPPIDAIGVQEVLQIASGVAAAADDWTLAAQLCEASRRLVPWPVNRSRGVIGGEDVPRRALEALGPQRYAEVTSAVRQLAEPRQLMELLPRTG